MDSKELEYSPQDFATQELSSIIDAVPKLSLESKEIVPISLTIDQIIEEIKLLDERVEKAKEKSATSTEFDKIRREISRQRMDLIRQGQTLSFMEFQKLHKEQRVRFRTQTKSKDDNYDIPEKELKKLTVDTLAEDKKSDYYRAIKAATSYRNHILELIDNIDGMITSLDHCPDFD